MKIIIFGAGAYAKWIWTQIMEEPQLYSDEYIAFADNNPSLWGKTFCEKEVIAPSHINAYKADLILIASNMPKSEDSMRKQLMEELGISEEQIYLFGEYTRMCYAGRVYREKYGNLKYSGKVLEADKVRTVVYTAITGNYDTLKEPLFEADGLTYVCITDNPDIKSKVWNIESIKNSRLDHIHLARHIKMNPHHYFPEYEVSIWVDGKYQIMDDLRTYAAKYQGHSDILCFPHPERNCICDETAACIFAGKGDKKEMIIQVSQYLREGYPVNSGLYETGCLVRNHNHDNVKLLMNQWEEEIMKHSYRDQLSFPYICWKNGFAPDICNLDINRNQWLLQKR